MCSSRGTALKGQFGSWVCFDRPGRILSSTNGLRAGSEPSDLVAEGNPRTRIPPWRTINPQTPRRLPPLFLGPPINPAEQPDLPLLKRWTSVLHQVYPRVNEDPRLFVGCQPCSRWRYRNLPQERHREQERLWTRCSRITL